VAREAKHARLCPGGNVYTRIGGDDLRERLRIGEIAGLVGVTPKTLRHYEKIGLLERAERSESGYRLYSANDLLRLNRIKKLRSLGLSLRQVRSVLGGGDRNTSIRATLTALRAEVEAEMARLEERRRRIDEALSREDLEVAEASPSFERAMELLGGQLSGVSGAALEQEKRFWSVLDAFEWPEGYEEENEEIFRYYAGHPEEYRELVGVGERLAALADLPETDPEVERVAEELWSYFERNPPPGHTERSAWSSPDPIGQALVELTMSAFSPAQRRVMALLVERAETEGTSGG
jgi:DNA-binding transcriptional MerR regulator